MGEWIERTFAPESAPDWSISSRERKARESTKANEATAAKAREDQILAEQKALQDQEEIKRKASTRLAASNSGFSGGTNTARSFLTTF